MGKSKKIFKGVGATLLIAGIVIAVVFLLGIVIQLLWNNLMPEIFGLTTISFWQGLGILVLFKILLGSDSLLSIKNHKDKKDKNNDKKDIDDEEFQKWWENEGELQFQEAMDKKNEDSD